MERTLLVDSKSGSAKQNDVGATLVAKYPMPGTRSFKPYCFGALLTRPEDCFASLTGDFVGRVLVMVFCPFCFFGSLWAKAGSTFWNGCCSFGIGIMPLRIAVRRHYGIRTEPTLLCFGGEWLATTFCFPCSSLQLDMHLDAMAAEGNPFFPPV